MGHYIYSLQKVPDLTLAQYSAEESGGVDEVIHQHSLFYRQLNRKGLLFDEIYHLIYLYNPSVNPGKRLSVFFRADSNQSPVCMDEFMQASPLSRYYKFTKNEPNEQIMNAVFPCRASLAKQDGMVKSSYSDRSTSFYTVNPWKPNEKARLIGLFRMMQRLQKPVAYVVSFKSVDMSESMRASFSSIIQFIHSTERSSISNRDDNADQSLRIYDKFLENLRSNPHYICRISAYASDESLAKMILDSAASEAVEEGNYKIICENGSFCPMQPSLTFDKYCIQEAPRGMQEWNSIFLLKEAVCFSMLPVLYPGETIEIPKESAPVYENMGLYLGKDNSGYDVHFPLSLLTKHALITGVPGSGKTFSMLHMSSQLAGYKNEIPVLVLEPAKKEYRALAHNMSLPEMTIFSPGGTGSFPLRINPFEFPKGFKLSEHITNLYSIFEGAFELPPPLPIFVMDGIEEVYRDHGWYYFEVNEGQHSYPTTQELFDKIASLLEEKKYEEDIKNNLITCLQTRIGSLLRREMGNVFNVSSSTFTPEEWLSVSCVIELEALGSYAGNFLTLLLLTIIREVIKQNPKSSKDKPRHVIFLEEAHNLIGPTTVANSENGDTKVASTKYVVDMLAEVRALGEAIVIADQLPTALAPQVTKNTSLKLGHRMTATDDREILATTMSADNVQFERMGSFQPGHALCTYESVQKPFEIQVCEYEAKSEAPDNEELYNLLKNRTIYQMVMERDLNIIIQKYDGRRERIKSNCKKIFEGKRNIIESVDRINNSDWEGTELKLAQTILQGNEIQYCRETKKALNEYVELIFEINEYTKMNRLFKKDLLKYLKDVIQEYIDVCKEILDGLPGECDIIPSILEKEYESSIREIGRACSWVS